VYNFFSYIAVALGKNDVSAAVKERGEQEDLAKERRLIVGTKVRLLVILLAVLFIAITIFEWTSRPDVYGSLGSTIALCAAAAGITVSLVLLRRMADIIALVLSLAFCIALVVFAIFGTW